MEIKRMNLPQILMSCEKSSTDPVMVCSHERSGTHFLINSIGINSLYSNNPIINFDQVPFGSIINFYNKQSVEKIIRYFKENNCSSIIKSHFSGDFFDQDRAIICGEFLKILYIYRDPLDVFRSYKDFVDFWPTHGGPKTKTLKEFITSQPTGAMMRYQYGQKSSIIERWEDHVTGWHLLSQKYKNILLVKYEDLNSSFEFEMNKVLKFINCPENISIKRPDTKNNTVHIPKKYISSIDEIEECKIIIKKLLKSDIAKNIVSDY